MDNYHEEKNLDTDPFYKSFFEKNPMLLPFAKQIPFVKGIDNNESIVEVLDIISQEYEACVVYGKNTRKINRRCRDSSKCFAGCK